MTSLIFFGNESFSYSTYNEAPIFEALARAGLVKALVIKTNRQRSRRPTRWQIIASAQAAQVPVYKVSNHPDLDSLQLPKTDLGIVASFGLILSRPFINRFPKHLYNIHPSLLPRYRGVSPIETALLDGVSTTGVTLIKISPDIDAGHILDQGSWPIKKAISKVDLTRELAQLGRDLLLKQLPLISQATDLKLRPQVEAQATYTAKIQPTLIDDWSKRSASFWQRWIRAYQACPNNRFLINAEVCEPLAAQALHKPTKVPIFYNRRDQSLNLACRSGYLSLSALKPANRAPMSAQAFVNGLYRTVPRLSL